MYNKWLESLNFTFITKDKYISITNNNNLTYYNKYVMFWDIFKEIVEEVKTIILKHQIKFNNLNHNPGCFNLNRNFYKYCAELNTGLPISKIGVYKIFKWGIREVNKIKNMMRKIIIKLEPDYKDLCFTELVKRINKSHKYKYKSKDEFITNHRNKLKEITDFFITEKKLPLLAPAKIIEFSEKNMADGYWYRDAFYLNTVNWKKTERFRCYALILHETIPGHHTQLSYELHSNKNSLFLFWYNYLTNGFAEGWALFSEKLGNNYTLEDMLGILSYNLLRSLRIIADISIHYYGVSPEDIIDLFKTYLPMNEKRIETEVYRYVSLPGQALGYKLGDYVFKAIFYKKFKRLDNLLGDDAIELYKELIISGSIPLELLCKKYNIDIMNLFKNY